MTSFRYGQWALRFLTAAGGLGVVCSCDLGERSVTPGSAGSSSTCGQPATDPQAINPFPCSNPMPYGNPDSGLERCDNGMLHRLDVGSCERASESPRGCLEDGDCPPDGRFGTICVCDETGQGVCQRSTCATDADCADGYGCVGSDYCSSNDVAFACQTPQDECATLRDCGGTTPPVGPCIWKLSCDSVGVPVHQCSNCGAGGRPFLIEAAVRTARTEPGSGWLDPSLTVSTRGVTRALCATLTLHWQEQAEMEHASVAAFARFVLELLSLGAPPDLVTAATDALADETAHARVCYALASSYAGQPLGPGELNVTGALQDLTLEGIVTRAVLEGCVGETLAAIEVGHAASHAVDETLRATLSRIAEDEARHAELSWRFLRWVLTRGGITLRQTVQRTFREAESQLRERAAAHVSAQPSDGPLLAHGVLSSRLRAQLAWQAFDKVIRPCERALRLESLDVARSMPAQRASQEALNG